MTALQDLLPHNHCYGCGPDNSDGLRIKSYWDGEVSTCTYMPRSARLSAAKATAIAIRVPGSWRE